MPLSLSSLGLQVAPPPTSLLRLLLLLVRQSALGAADGPVGAATRVPGDGQEATSTRETEHEARRARVVVGRSRRLRVCQPPLAQG